MENIGEIFLSTMAFSVLGAAVILAGREIITPVNAAMGVLIAVALMAASILVR